MTEQEAQDTTTEFELMDREDEEQILADLRGVPVDKFVYKNKRGEFELTYAGTKWVVRKMAELGEAIRIEGHPKVERCQIDPEYLTVTVLGKRIKVDREAKVETVLDTTVGSARQWIKQKINNGATVIQDEHFFTKCVSRATRNMQQSLIPYDFKKDMIQELVKMQGGSAAQRPAQQRPPQGQQQKPPGQPPAQGSTPQGQKGGQASSPPQNQSQSQTKPPGAPAGQQKASGAKPQGQAAPKGSQGEPSLEAVQQGFRAVFIQFAGTEDKTTLQKILKALTGKTAVTELEKGVMTELGPILRRKIKGEVKFTGTALHEISSGEQLWPKPEPQAEPQAEPTAEEGPPPQDDSIPMF